jgi:hypothetical protein
MERLAARGNYDPAQRMGCRGRLDNPDLLIATLKIQTHFSPADHDMVTVA